MDPDLKAALEASLEDGENSLGGGLWSRGKRRSQEEEDEAAMASAIAASLSHSTTQGESRNVSGGGGFRPIDLSSLKFSKQTIPSADDVRKVEKRLASLKRNLPPEASPGPQVLQIQLKIPTSPPPPLLHGRNANCKTAMAVSPRHFPIHGTALGEVMIWAEASWLELFLTPSSSLVGSNISSAGMGLEGNDVSSEDGGVFLVEPLHPFYLLLGGQPPKPLQHAHAGATLESLGVTGNVSLTMRVLNSTV